MKKYLPYIIFFSALLISTCAAFYSVFGLSKLFAGSANSVIVMASSLEFSKVVIASAINRYWNILSILMKSYLVSALVILILITSLGIYGFLSAAYQTTSNKEEVTSIKVESLESRKNEYLQQKNALQSEKTLSDKNLSDMRNSFSLSTQNIKSGQYSTGKLDKQLTKSQNRNNYLTEKIGVLADSINNINSKISDLKVNNTSTSELGPIKYIASITGYPMDKVVNIIIFLIIFVFDPLAIVLVLLANTIFINEDSEVEEQPNIQKTDVSDSVTIANEENSIIDAENSIADIIKKYKTSKQKTKPQIKGPLVTEIINTSQDQTGSVDLSPRQIKNMTHQEVKSFINKPPNVV